MKLILVFVVISCALAAEVKEKEDPASPALNKDKRQVQGQYVPGLYRPYRTRKQERITPVEESQEEDHEPIAADRSETEEYRPGQVISVNHRELLELQPERKAPVSNTNSNQLQSLYNTDIPEHQQNLQALQDMYTNTAPSKQVQQFFYFDPQYSQQMALQPSRTVIARPSLSNGGEASVGAALSVSDNGAQSSETSLDQELFALLGQAPGREEQSQTYSPAPQTYSPAPQTYSPAPQTYSPAAPQTYSPAPQTFTSTPATVQQVTQSPAQQYQQIDRYLTKPTKKPTRLHAKVQQPQPQQLYQQQPQQQYQQQQQLSSAPQQYLIETTNVAQQQQQPRPQLQQQYRFVQQLQQAPQLQQSPQLQQAPQYQQIQQQRPAQALRYVQVPQPQQASIYYEKQENEGLKIVAAPKLQQPRQYAYRILPQYQQEAAPKEYRVLSPRPQPQPQLIREQPRYPAQTIDRPLTYVKAYSDAEKMRAVKIIEPTHGVHSGRQPHYLGEQYFLRPVYRSNEPQQQQPQQQPRYEVIQHANPDHYVEQSKPPHSVIYVNKNIVPKKVQTHHHMQQHSEVAQQPQRAEQPSRVEHINLEQHGQSLEEQRAQLPPPKNNKAYTPQEFAALVAAGYSVTPIPVSSLSSPQGAQSRSVPEPAQPTPNKRRPLASRRNQYLPLRSDEAP